MPSTSSSRTTAKSSAAAGSANQPSVDAADMRRLIEEQGKQLAEVQALVQKVYNYVWWQRVWGVAKVIILVVPLILGILYLPPLLENAFTPYRELLGGSDQSSQFEVKDLLHNVTR